MFVRLLKWEKCTAPERGTDNTIRNICSRGFSPNQPSYSGGWVGGKKEKTRGKG